MVKRARVNVSDELMVQLLRLPEGARVVGALTDFDHGGVTLYVVGFGVDVPEGQQAPIVPWSVESSNG